MTKIAILPVPDAAGAITYCAVAGDKRSQGDTAGRALDALTAQLPKGEGEMLVVVQGRKPDSFFSAEQQQRLAELMDRWRAGRSAGQSLPAEDQAELESLVDLELRASAARAAAISDEAGL